MSPLGAVQERHAALPADLRSRELSRVLADDLAAAAAGFPACAVARTAEARGALLAQIPGAAALEPYQAVGDWEPEVRGAVQRARLLVVLTTAKQLLPQQIATLLGWAAEDGVPVALLVEGAGRIRDPARHLSDAVQTVASTWRLGAHAVIGLGDARHAGPTLQAAVEQALALAAADVEERLARLRQADLTRWLTGVVAEAGKAARSRSADVGLARDSRVGMEVLGSAAARDWSERLSAFHDCVRRLDPEALADRALLEASGVPAVKLFLERLRDQLQKDARQAGKALEKELDEARRAFLSSVRSDLARLVAAHLERHPREAQDNARGDVKKDALQPELKQAIADVERRLEEAVQPDALLVRVAEFVDARARATTAPAKRRPPRPKEGAGDEEAGGGIKDGIATVLRNVPGQVIRGHMVRTGHRVVAELSAAVDEARQRAALEWEERARALVEEAYRPWTEALVARRDEAQARFAMLTAALAQHGP